MKRIDRATADLPADPDQVFAALRDERALLSWLPPSDMIGRFEHFDMRTGGSYRMTLTYRDGQTAEGKSSAGTDVVDVRIVEIVPSKRIVQEVHFPSEDPRYSGTMKLTWAVSPAREGTRVELRAENVPPGITARDHTIGMNSSLENLRAYLRWGAE